MTEATEAVIIFDLDGTLVDSGRDIHEALRIALSEVDEGRISQEADREALRLGCHGLPLQPFFRRARPFASPAALADFVAAYRRTYSAHLLDTTRPFAGVMEGLSRLSALRPLVRLAIATTKMTATAQKVTCGLGLSRHFDLVLGSDGLPCKPDPAVLHAVFARLGLERRAGMMIGDTDHDIVAGRAAGLSTCAVGWSALPKAQLQAAGPDHHVSHFSEVVDLVLRMIPDHD